MKFTRINVFDVYTDTSCMSSFSIFSEGLSGMLKRKKTTQFNLVQGNRFFASVGNVGALVFEVEDCEIDP